MNIKHFQDNPLENLNLAFDIAEKYLDIPRMLDPEGNTFQVFWKYFINSPAGDKIIFCSNFYHWKYWFSI